ncbi:MAG: DNA ligase-associated DEXH box helicase, partial [Pacificimonas sp.]
ASEALIVPGNRFEYLEARAALDAVADGELDEDVWRPGSLDVLAQHIMACACADPFDAGNLYNEVRTASPYALLDRETFDRVLGFIESGGYSLRAYDKYKRITQGKDGLWRISHPRFAKQHRLNAGIIVDAPVLDVRFRNGRKLGTVEEYFASTLAPGDTFYFSGIPLEVEGVKDADLLVKATTKPARIPTYVGTRMPLTTNLANRVRRFLNEPEEWRRFPADVQEWLEVQGERSVLPKPDQLLVETFPRDGRHYMVAYSFEGWNAHQSLGMLITRRMESMGLSPIGFVSNDYAISVFSLKPVEDPRPLFSPDILEDELVEWVNSSNLLKRAFREVAVIGGLIERHIPGKRKTGRQVTFSTDLIYDVLRKYEPDHMLLKAAWEDAKGRMTDIARLAGLLDRAPTTMVHKQLDRISPMAVPIMVLIGREKVAMGTADDELLLEAESLAEEAMRLG